MKKHSIEILAPAGNLETAKAAIQAGADSVYFGGKAFNARRNAANFSREDVEECLRFCHLRGKRAYLTLNTILYDEELTAALDEVAFAAEAGIDGVIVQDLGLFRILRKTAPQLPIHTSTQLSAHCVSDCTMLKKMGAKRVVVARELSKEEIRRICNNVDVEIKAFVHGALCMSVSGQCYFSSALGERSGNRGLCAQVCRLPFSADDKENHALSLKDMSLIGQVGEFADMGVASLKIEGRMKGKEYAQAVSQALVLAREGKPYDEAALKNVFSRSGFTKGYYEGKLGGQMFGVRGEADKEASRTAKLPPLEKETPSVGIHLRYRGKLGEPFTLQVRDVDGNQAHAHGELCAPAQSRGATKESVSAQLGKLGGTVYYALSTEGELEEGLYLSAAALNKVRRDALSTLDRLREAPRPVPFHREEICLDFIPRGKRAATPALIARFSSAGQVTREAMKEADEAFIPLFELAKLPKELFEEFAGKWGVELPRVYFKEETPLIQALDEAKKKGVRRAMCHTPGRVLLAQEAGFAVTGGFGLNTSNTLALEELKEEGVARSVLSCEVSLKRIAHMGEVLPIGIVAYGHFPVMLTRNCPLRAQTVCRHKDCALTDRKGMQFRTLCANGVTELLNPQPIYLADKLPQLRVLDFLELRFTVETGAECSKVLKEYRNGGSRQYITRGTYFRDIL